MKVVVNGEERSIAEGAAIIDVIESLGLNASRVAVEINRRIVRRAEWASTPLAEGDKVEIVHFVGGGADRL